jgi:hypothetical protein
MAPALVMRTASNFFAHDSVQMPFSSVLFRAFYNRFKFCQELDIFFVFQEIPMRSGKGLSRRLSSFKAKHHLFWTIHPWFEFFERDLKLEGQAVRFGV